ncbi:mitogen-activated protein kinase kinase kinase 20-like [Henckelia pumila]|uniref:mitogen-activated protein kinase kinase kinase 20-like n=1 Tax=Henckelia pumila TaxID=405737 RepID=UPI003C6E0E55
MDWVRGEKLGHGSSATVNLAMPRRQTSLFPPLMAVKSGGVVRSSSLMNEKLILEALKDCPQIIRCFGDSFSYENGEKLYNVLLEYAPGGSLADKIKNSGYRSLPESETRRYTKALLKGLHYIHKLGYVHCDIKLQNILLGPEGGVKIADFGLAKRAGGRKESFSGCELRGTPLYMSPESVTVGEQGTPADIWALGCAVAEMATGTPAWHCSDVAGLLLRIGAGEELPEVPKSLSELGKDFLGKCLVRDPSKRWTAEMLLNHPFVLDDQDFDFNEEEEENKALISPTCPFDFPEWESSVSSSSTTFASPEYPLESGSWSMTPARRLQNLGSDQFPDWSVTDNWITLR